LLEAGALAVETIDRDAGTPAEQPRYAEPGIADDSPWPRAQLMALVSADIDARRVLALAAGALGVDAPPATFDGIEEQDWIRASQAQFGPVHVGRQLHVVPTWCDASGEGVTIRLDPGLAFGTGSHATTRLCLEWLELTLRGGESLLDYGCGSGILSIAAAKLGAARVVGTDIDAQAVRSSAANAAMNGVAAEFVAPDALVPETFDIVVANILANPLILLAPVLATRVRGGGRIALSGILETQADEIVEAYARWFTLRAWRAADGWVLIAGERVG
jgi:ribosomal protein L11 methyltransferase